MKSGMRISIVVTAGTICVTSWAGFFHTCGSFIVDDFRVCVNHADTPCAGSCASLFRQRLQRTQRSHPCREKYRCLAKIQKGWTWCRCYIHSPCWNTPPGSTPLVRYRMRGKLAFGEISHLNIFCSYETVTLELRVLLTRAANAGVG